MADGCKRDLQLEQHEQWTFVAYLGMRNDICTINFW